MQGFYSYALYFFIYSCLGWLCECVLSAVRKKRFVNRGVLNGPLCCIYGFAAVAITLGFSELKGSLFFLFIGSAVVAGLIEWLSGHFLERLYRKKWWDYSHRRFHIDGYVSLQSALLWGVAGVLGIYFFNPFFLQLALLVPATLLQIVLWVLIGFTVLDAIGSFLVIWHIPHSQFGVDKINEGLDVISRRLNHAIRRYVHHRMRKAYPALADELKRPIKIKARVFAEGCSAAKLFIIFLIGAFLGDLVEMVFCRVTMGVWMSRSSVVWGPFSIVWGLALALATLLLYNYREKSDGFIFIFGTVIGGVYEYLCSVFTELVFGVVFWDYSEIPFNLGGRVNLLYCFFWGIAAVLWLKKCYPPLSNLIEMIPMRIGNITAWLLLAFMLCNVSVSVMALTRSAQRAEGLPAEQSWQQWMDQAYGDDVLNRIYPNSISTKEST